MDRADCRRAVEELVRKRKVEEEDILKLEDCGKELLKSLSQISNCRDRKKVLYALCKLAELGRVRADRLADVVKAVKRELKGDCPWTKGVAAEFAGKLGMNDMEIVELVVKALEDSCPWVRHRAADALSSFCRNPEFARIAYRALIRRLDDSSPYVQNYAFHALKVCLETFESHSMSEAEEVKKAMKKVIPLS